MEKKIAVTFSGEDSLRFRKVLSYYMNLRGDEAQLVLSSPSRLMRLLLVEKYNQLVAEKHISAIR